MSSTPEQDAPEAATPAVDPVDENIAIIARQAIVDESRAVYGYELFDRSTASDAHTAASDAALLFNALSYAGTEALVGKKTVFINCTHDSLSGGHLELIHPEKVVLEVPPLPEGATTEKAVSPPWKHCVHAVFAWRSTSRSSSAPTPAGCRSRPSSSWTCRPSSPNWQGRW